jgi:Protein of unknown function (DUF1573)
MVWDMRKNLVFIVIISLMLGACKEKDRKVTSDMLNFPQTASGTQEMPLPVASFDSLQMSFGKIAVGEKVRKSFHFTNTGDAPLLITDVKPSCGCTSLKDWPQGPIEPGEGGQITLEFNSEGQNGPISKSIVVHTNAVPTDVYLKLVGEVAGVTLTPDSENGGIKMERTR